MDRYQPVFNRNEPGLAEKRVQDQPPVPHWLDGRVPASKSRATGPGDIFFYRNRTDRVANDTVDVPGVNDQGKGCRRLDELNRKKSKADCS